VAGGRKGLPRTAPKRLRIGPSPPSDRIGHGPVFRDAANDADRRWRAPAETGTNDPLRTYFDLGQQERRGTLLPSGIRIVLRRMRLASGPGNDRQ
jgi:hypothetical protein